MIQRQYEGGLPGCPYVFHRHARRIYSFDKAWDRACLLAGCPGMLFHDFRRTAARNLRRADLSEAQAMAITGHKTPSIFRRYSIIAESDLRDAVWRAQAFMTAERAGKRAKNVLDREHVGRPQLRLSLPSARESNRLRKVRP